MSVQHKKNFTKLDNQDLVKKGLAAIARKFLETRKVRLRDGKGFFLFIRILIFSKNATYFVIDPYPFPPSAFQKIVLKQKLTIYCHNSLWCLKRFYEGLTLMEEC